MGPARREEFSSKTQGMSVQVLNIALKGWISRQKKKEVVLSPLMPHNPWLMDIIWL